MDDAYTKTECFINARFLTQPTTGVQRVGMELVKALDEILDGDEEVSRRFAFTMLAPKNVRHRTEFKHIPLRCVGTFSGHLWEQLELPWYTRNRMLINLCNVAPLVKRNQAVTIHDAIVFAVPGTCSVAFRTWYRLLIPRLARFSRVLVTDSEFSRRELAGYTHVSADRFEIISLGREHIGAVEADETILEAIPNSDRPFLLAVSSLSPHKNFRSLVRAVELLEDQQFSIVIAGGTNRRVFSRERLAMPASAVSLGYVSDGALRALYEHAAGFVYPSVYEGFGLPPVEAMACGCPVIVSSIPPLREVCGDAALYCDPHDPRDIAARMTELMSDSRLRERLIEKGYERAGRYSWRQAAVRYLNVLSRAMGCPAHGAVSVKG
ncbi:MAG TPA: glycosyltransferase family 1 protein [Acidobacteriota bacterium]|nr:glycosyltransferase family 1 protein [Acidobacteriota bacterium]